jgi:hypothetical protein
VAATLTGLSTLVLDLSDHTSTARVTTARLYDYINMQIREVAAMMAAVAEDRPWKEASITLVPGTEAYAIDDTCQHVDKVWYMDGTDRYLLERFEKVDLDYNRYETENVIAQNESLRYRVMEDTTANKLKIWFHPIPATAGTAKVWYKSKPVALTAGTDALPLSWPEVAQDFIVYGATSMVMARDQDQHDYWTAQKEMARGLLKEALMHIDQGQAPRIQDVY